MRRRKRTQQSRRWLGEEDWRNDKEERDWSDGPELADL
jgi:hypothetical protein